MSGASQGELNRLRRRVAELEEQLRASISNGPGDVRADPAAAIDIRERTRTEEAARTREEVFRTLISNLPDVVSRFDRNLRFLYISPAVEENTGAPPEHYIGKTHAEAGLPEDISAMLEANLREIFETGKPGSVEFDFLSRARGLRHFFGIAVPEFGSDGRVKTVLTIVRDTTEQRRAEEAQQAVERELMLLVEASSALLASPHSREVLQTIIELAQCFVAADGHAVWRQIEDGMWSLACSAGLSERFVRADTISSSSAPVLPSGPLVVEDIEREPLLESRKVFLQQEGIRSILAVPLRIHGAISGTVVFYWRAAHQFTGAETRIAVALGNLAAAALGTAELYDRQISHREAAEASERRTAFLAGAGALLSSS
ncbi:MAG: PAS domain S-box protein, partial [Bryobacteraceae bacterium]